MLTPLLYLLNKCISVKSALQIFSLKDDHTFCFSNVLIIDLHYSSANSLFYMI